MSRKQLDKASRFLAIVFLGLWLQACGTTRMVTIDSTPAGATIIADGKQIGTTPMEIDAGEVFPPRWVGTSFTVKGKLELEKEGCRKVKVPIDDSILMDDINRSLDCGQGAAASNKANSSTVGETATHEGIQQRLNKLKDLHEQGVISKEEYQQQRQRILNEL